MKEIILHAAPRQNGHIVLTALAGTTITVNNVLGIINKTTGKVVYTPLKFGTISVGTVALSDGTYPEIIFGQDVPEQPADSQFFIKLYLDGDASDAAEQVKSFFGIVKDGDTVKVVTGDGGEEIVEPVGLMDEDDVYDYLEDIAVLLGGITAQQAASITAATRAIIHGGSGSGEGGEGGSGSGSGE